MEKKIKRIYEIIDGIFNLDNFEWLKQCDWDDINRYKGQIKKRIRRVMLG